MSPAACWGGQPSSLQRKAVQGVAWSNWGLLLNSVSTSFVDITIQMCLVNESLCSWHWPSGIANRNVKFVSSLGYLFATMLRVRDCLMEIRRLVVDVGATCLERRSAIGSVMYVSGTLSWTWKGYVYEHTHTLPSVSTDASTVMFYQHECWAEQKHQITEPDLGRPCQRCMQVTLDVLRMFPRSPKLTHVQCTCGFCAHVLLFVHTTKC